MNTKKTHLVGIFLDILHSFLSVVNRFLLLQLKVRFIVMDAHYHLLGRQVRKRSEE